MAQEAARVAWRSYHDWVLPVRAVQAILAGALLLLFLGLFLLAVGGGVQVSGLIAAGAVLAGIGACGLLVCLLLCLHAYFIFNIRDQACQTSDHPWSDDVVAATTPEIGGYAVINKPSNLKSGDTLRRNGAGNGGLKKVTMAPDVALDADVRAPALRTTASGDSAQAHVTPAQSPNLILASPASPGYRTVGNFAGGETSGGGGRVSGASAMESFDQRSFAQHQQFQDVHKHQQQGKQQQQQQQQISQSQGGLQRQRDDTDIQRQRQQLEYHRQHLMQHQPPPHQQHQQHQQHKSQQQQQQHFRVQVQQPPQPQPQQSGVTYAQIQRFQIPVQHSPSPSMSSQQSSVFTTGSVREGGGGIGGGGGAVSGFSTLGAGSTLGGYGTGSSMGGGYGTGSSMGGYGTGTGSTLGGYGTGKSMGGYSVGTTQTSSSFGSYKIQTQGLQYQSGRPYREDDDYDNPAESAPMLAQSSPSYTAASSSAKGVSFSGSVQNAGDSEIPEPAPLQYPSERRPMTFEQQSSSKMSIYDNVLFPYAEADGE